MNRIIIDIQNPYAIAVYSDIEGCYGLDCPDDVFSCISKATEYIKEHLLWDNPKVDISIVNSFETRPENYRNKFNWLPRSIEKMEEELV